MSSKQLLRRLKSGDIAGNATVEEKGQISQLAELFVGKEGSWGYKIKEDTTLVAVDVNPQVQGPRKEAALTFEIVVQPCTYDLFLPITHLTLMLT